jgi:hypothetical protein
MLWIVKQHCYYRNTDIEDVKFLPFSIFTCFISNFSFIEGACHPWFTVSNDIPHYRYSTSALYGDTDKHSNHIPGEEHMLQLVYLCTVHSKSHLHLGYST